MRITLILPFLTCLACANDLPDENSTDDPSTEFADVVEVVVSGEPGAYQFSVTLESPDTGCDQYADWWEVVSSDGALLYRRILTHSHVEEQPFTRSGSPVAIATDQEVWVRAHMKNRGYGGITFYGNAVDGFAKRDMPVDFATSLGQEAPLPDGCRF
ncbi:MAG: hypothetical protein JXQ90_18990 [Cyclobacteriaceae bacterium]